MADTCGEIERMNDIEAVMWAVEVDPHLSSTFANITLLDRPPDIDRLWARMWRASRTVPRLRRKVVDPVGPLNPYWTDDLDFDLANHLTRTTLPDGATEADAHRFAARLASEPLDRSRPMWHFTILEGLPDGRAAMVQRMHHTITDGEGGIRMSVEYIDLDRDSPDPEPVDDGPPNGPGRVDPMPSHGPVDGVLDRAIAPLRITVETVEEMVRRGFAGAERLAGVAADVSRDPVGFGAGLVDLPGEAAATLRSMAHQYLVLDGQRSPLWSGRSLDRTLHPFDVPLGDVKEAAHRLGGTVNDVFVAAVAGAAGAHHRARGMEVGDLRMAMPVSTRTTRADGSGGNAFTPTRVLIPTGTDPRSRFEEVHRRLKVTKSEPANHHAAALAGVISMVPRHLLARVARQQVASVDFTTSNVRAAPFDLFIAGALMEANYPLGPLAGTAWNLTTMSYRGSMNMGLVADPAAVDDPDGLAADIQTAFAELFALT